MLETLLENLKTCFSEKLTSLTIGTDRMVTAELPPSELLTVARVLREDSRFQFSQLMDVCGVDYKAYGETEWRTEETTASGFSRGQSESEYEQFIRWNKPRYASVYHLLSVTKNQRLRLRVFLDEKAPQLPSVVSVWNSATWFEREAFDLFGFIYEGHPDLRRLLTDYGFVGHPFRKDFPLVGEVELRFDALEQRCVYGPVSIQPRVNIPKVVRRDNRYLKMPGDE